MIGRRRAIACSLAPLVSCGYGAKVCEPEIAALENAIPDRMAAYHVPGLSLALIHDARVHWSRGFGVVDTATIFEAASMSKPVFAYAVMKLCEKGVMALDTPLVKYGAKRFIDGDPRLDQITARHVLSHTSGFPDIRSSTKPLRTEFPPGEKWLYSGEGYAYLQSVMTHLTGKSFAEPCGTYEADMKVCATDFGDFMRTNLLAPFGMDSSSYHEPRAAHLARPHDSAGKPLPVRNYNAADTARYGAMGSLLTTATDYAKFLIEVMAPKPADSFRLNAASLAEMLRPQVKVDTGPDYSIDWALGWRVAQTPAGVLIGHGGNQTGFHSLSEISIARRTGFVMLTNGDDGWKLLNELAPAISKWVNLPA